MTDMLRQMRPNEFRGIKFPITDRSFGFAQEQDKQRYVFRDKQLIESMGQENPAWKYTIPFREGIARGPYKNLFITTYAQFLRACEDRSAATLIDCVNGPKLVKCASWSEQLDVTKKDGVDVTVEFVLAPDEDAVTRGPDPTLPIETLEAGREYAGFLDKEIEKVDWPEQERPERKTDFFDAINSVGDQASVFQGRAEAMMHKLAYDCERTTDTIDKLKDPRLGTTRRANRRMHLAANRLAKELREPPQPMRTVRTVTEMGKLSCAALYNMPVEEFDALNQNMRRLTRIPANTVLVVPRG